MAISLTINVQTVTAEPGPTLFDYAEKMGMHVPSSCHKQGKCRECLMEVTEGMQCLSSRSEEEKHLKGDFRLSCCARVVAPVGTLKASTMRRGTMRVEDRAIHLPKREAEVLEPAVTRDGLRILLDGTEIARSSEPIYGLAMDLGTTTVALRLINLETGKTKATTSFENPQRFGGTDVMARIQYDTDHSGRILQRTLLGYLKRAIHDFAVNPETIYEMVIVGNSTMRDLFFGLNVHSIGQRPYRSLTEYEWRDGKRATTSLSCKARQLGLPMHPEGRVYGLPLVSGHVGADAAACLLAMDIANEDRLVALMDIGTNTELFLGNKRRLLAASCPAGPAFEGRAIRCGMPGLDGAIEKVSIDENGKVRTRVIGGGKAEGICGSGLIDLLSELLRTGRMNELGRFEEIVDPFVVDAAQGVFFSESDVNELAQAKGANVAGLQIVAKHYGCSLDEIDVFYVAGGFGKHLDLSAAKRIGLIPDLPDEKIVQVGNAAIEGASIALLSISSRMKLYEMLKHVVHVELETDPGFFDYFVSGCQFQPVRSNQTMVNA
jgi:uncharacterized 2Fe-2S/4Fe-4S cluster protein (DUF4445 family)